ncbi:hypothetical protein SCOR_23935 [Sulfidibacter corallicola]|uniref:GYF domain-containing protein n=1 Tax=Sulfidibacter corallicola TaxID=2818388 RepID=A0A8A4TRE2_SULCO|nr:DUF4339 domain-containing protein [Sulfidibacter corallicola]QTD52539.1 hypothetical protein J3U87_08705 [Sulfidibacter corallicola]
MSKSGWYIEKRGKFYGPFSREKILEYADKGKITGETMVALTSTGENAKPFRLTEGLATENAGADSGPSTLPDAGPAGASDVPKVPKPPQPKPKTPSRRTESAVPPDQPLPTHFYLEESGRSQGPYDLDQLKRQVAQKSVNPDAKLSYPARDRKYKTVGELLKNFVEGPLEVSKSHAFFLLQGSDRKGPFTSRDLHRLNAARAIHPRTMVEFAKSPARVITIDVLLDALPQDAEEHEPRILPVKPSRFSYARLGMILFCLVLIGGAVWGLYRWRQQYLETHAPAPPPENPKSLRALMRQREIPPFNDLVIRALSHGLNFNVNQVVAANQGSQMDDQRVASFRHESLFPGRIAREIRFIVDGPFYFNYLADPGGNVFAVVIEGPNWDRLYLSGVDTTDFAPKVLELDRPGGKVWQAEIGSGVVAQVLWSPDRNDHHLTQLIVTNAP